MSRFKSENEASVPQEAFWIISYIHKQLLLLGFFDSTEKEKLLQQLSQIVNKPYQLESFSSIDLEEESNRYVSTSEVMNNLIEYLTLPKSEHDKSLFFTYIGTIVFDSAFISYFFNYRDKDNRNALMRLLVAYNSWVMDPTLINEIIVNWLQLGFKIDGTDRRSLSLGDYLLGHSEKSYKTVVESTALSFNPSHPISSILISSNKEKILKIDLNEILEYFKKSELADLDFLLLANLLTKLDNNIENDLIKKLVNESVVAKKLFHYFLGATPIRVRIAQFVFPCVIRLSLRQRIRTDSQLSQLLSSFTPLTIEEVLCSINENKLTDFEIIFLYELLRHEDESIINYSIEALFNHSLSVPKRMLNIFFMGLKNSIHFFNSDPVELYKNYQSNLRLYYPIQTSQETYQLVSESSKTLFGEIAIQRAKMKERNDIFSEKLVDFDRKENLVQAALPLQNFFSATKRKLIHSQCYPLASYEDKIYSPVCPTQELFIKIRESVEKVNFIKYIKHITNQRYLDQVLETVFSRNLLKHKRIPFIPAALDEVVEKADFDVTCFYIKDVDSKALQNASRKHPPVKLTLNFKKLLKSRSWIPGQLFVKEHDMYWTSKPNSTEKKLSDSRNREAFTEEDIPSEFADEITLGSIKFKMYRNSCGVKFLLGKNKYVIQYLYGDYYAPDKDKLSKSKVREVIVEKNFGQTLFYGDPRDIEKFFVMQFFRHIDKFSELKEIIYQELSSISDREMIKFFNRIGRKLAHGAELNFQRGLYIPMECISKIQILSGFRKAHKDKESLCENYGANGFFKNSAIKSITIRRRNIVRSVEMNDLDTLHQFKKECPQLFASARFLRFLLKTSSPESPSYDLLASWFDSLLSSTILPNDSVCDAVASNKNRLDY